MAVKKSVKPPALVRAQLLWLLPVFLIPFLLQAAYLLNAFYHFGAVFNDMGWLANTTWHNTWALPNPFQYGDYSILLIHCYLILELANIASSLVPLSMPEFYALLNGSIYAGFAVFMFIGLWFCMKPRDMSQKAIIALVAIGYAFNGVVMQGVWMSHIEYAIPLGMFAFILCRALRRPLPALFAFCLTLSVREDAGFHIAGILILLSLTQYAEKRDIKAALSEIRWIAAAIGYSVFALAMSTYVRTLHPEIPHSLFTMTYAGSPAYAHLTWQLLADRANILFAERSYIWLPALITFGWAAYKRDAYLAIGFVAFIPWFLLNWTATLENTGKLYAYYAFPFVLSLGWPVLSALWRYRANVPQKLAQETLILQIVLVTLSLVQWDTFEKHITLGPLFWTQYGSFMPQQGTIHRGATQAFADKVHSDDKTLGTIMGDQGAVSLLASPKFREMLKLDMAGSADTLVYFHMEQRVAEQVKKNHWPFHYCINGTPICMFSNRAPERLHDFSSLVVSRPSPTPR